MGDGEMLEEAGVEEVVEIAQKSPLEEILDWSQRRHSWWRDAVRRILQNGNLTDLDIAALAEICIKDKSGEDIDVLVEFFTAEHLPTAGVGTTSVISLTKVAEPQNINAIEDGQELKFNPEGLSVVYGNNGSGKSGYTRILKQVCLSRGGEGNILKNIRDTDNKLRTAKIHYQIDGEDKDVVWGETGCASSDVSHVTVFDTSASNRLVEAENEVAFRPLGLDVLDKLADTCVKVKQHIEGVQSTYSTVADLSCFNGETTVSAFIQSLSHETAEEQVDGLALLSEEQEARYNFLHGHIPMVKAEDPLKLARESRSRSSKLRDMSERIQIYTEYILPEKIQELSELLTQFNTSKRAVELASTNLSETSELPDAGSVVWVELWKAAKAYSINHAYPDNDFPNIGEDARCILCQQPLDAASKERVTTFDDFVEGAVQKQLGDSIEKIEQKIGSIDGVRFAAEADAICLEYIQDINGELSQQTSDYFGKINVGLTKLKCAMALECPLPTFEINRAIIPGIAAICETLNIKATEYEEANDPEKLQELESEFVELSARKLLATKKERVVAEITRLKHLNVLSNGLRTTNSRSITDLSNRLTGEHVTAALQARFVDELNVLGFRTMPVELVQSRSERGVVYHKLIIQNCGSDVGDILSEGEHRCVALAAFLAELETLPSIAGVVFDDPVSSLDHIWRGKVAKRLVAESQTRQVVIFTHDIPFLMMLHEASEEVGEEPFEQNLQRRGASTGICNDGPSWHAMKAKARIGLLKNDWQKLDVIRRTGTDGDYIPAVGRLYGLLRETWERTIEEVFLNGTVMRFSRAIRTQQLAKVDILPDDYARIESGMSKCSKFMAGHDEAVALGEPLPEPDEIMADIGQLDAWRTDVVKRRG